MFLELKMENERLQHRIHELRARKAPFIRVLSGPRISSLGPAAHFGGNSSSATDQQGGP